MGDASATCEYGLSVARFDVVEISTTDRLDKFAADKIHEYRNQRVTNLNSKVGYRQCHGGEGGITLALVNPIVCPLVDFPLAFCQAQNAVREGFEPSVAFWATAL